MKILSFFVVLMLITSCAFAVFANPAQEEKTEEAGAGSKKTETEDQKDKEGLTVPCLAQVNSANSKAEVTAFGGLELDNGLRMILTDVIRQLKADGCSVGFVVVDIRSGQGFAYDPDRPFYSASSIKGHYVAAMTYYYPESFEYFYDVIESVLIYSDNYGYEYLWESYGMECIEEWAQMADITDVDFSELYTDYSARDLAKFWLLDYAYFENKNTDKELPKLYETPEISRIHEVLGGKYKTRSKAGWIPEYYDVPTYDDGGIIYAGDSPYVIAFLSDIPEEYMEKSDGIIRLFDIIHRMMVNKK